LRETAANSEPEELQVAQAEKRKAEVMLQEGLFQTAFCGHPHRKLAGKRYTLW